MSRNIEFPKPKTFYQEIEEIMNSWEHQTNYNYIESAKTIRDMADRIYKKRLIQPTPTKQEEK